VDAALDQFEGNFDVVRRGHCNHRRINATDDLIHALENLGPGNPDGSAGTIQIRVDDCHKRRITQVPSNADVVGAHDPRADHRQAKSFLSHREPP
jgi:hypothetical protein